MFAGALIFVISINLESMNLHKFILIKLNYSTEKYTLLTDPHSKSTSDANFTAHL